VPDILTFDMGGASTDVSLCLDGIPPKRREIRLG
jgi:N-methylhydantoinase A/oxoprolinase/acetone carboxylase beta subunit